MVFWFFCSGQLPINSKKFDLFKGEVCGVVGWFESVQYVVIKKEVAKHGLNKYY